MAAPIVHRGGRRRKPVALALIQGTGGRSAGGRALPEDIGAECEELNAAPPDLTAEQKAEWEFAISHAPIGVLKQLDRGALKSWCVAVVAQDIANRCIDEEGEVTLQPGGTRTVTKKDGTVTVDAWPEKRVINPWTRVRDRAFERMRKAAFELGFTPTSRARIAPSSKSSSGTRSKAANRFAKLAAKRTG